ncbi:OstA family protein [Tardibacter chloracetimidivorans]|uniref:OstA family protein n=1 Tax=Tardibacter chloracetimidivorans TaxID=1921510 RepID=A0A1L3ZZJ3_9SPHN|nr:LptA/OstA family protein [Tardibacter chloracetimidivorans]API61053.1 OstA family protein [Tardibacter chloracetimidivorans]
MNVPSFRPLRARLLISGLFLALAAPAMGQAVSVLKGHDSKQPVDVDADRIEVQDRQDRAVFSGNVKVRQGNLAIDAARLRVAYRNASGQGLEILRIDADGGVQVRSPSESARGDYGIYDLNSRIITLIGSVSLNRGDTQVRGQRLVMDLNTGRSTLDGGNVASPDGGRVSGRFVVPQRSGD